MNDLEIKNNKFLNYVDKLISLNKLSHSYLIELSQEEDMKYVYSFIKLILCENKDKKIDKLNCLNCNICQLIDNNNYPDLKIIEADGMWIKKNQLMDLMDDFQNKSLLNNKKIYVIKYAENLNLSSANSILKFLEEPEDDIIAILLTKNRYKVINTISSRCQILSLNSSGNIINLDDDIIKILNYLVNPVNLFIDYNVITKSVFIDKEKTKTILYSIENCLVKYLDYISNDSISCDDDIIEILKKVDVNKIIIYISIIEDEIVKLEFNVNLKIWLDGLFSRFVEVK